MLRLTLAPRFRATKFLHPRGEPRGSPIAAVVLTGAEIDQTAGLLALRERQPFSLFATAETMAALGINPIFRVLSGDLVARRSISVDKPLALPGGVTAELFAVPGKVALYLEGDDPALKAEAGANVGIEMILGNRRLVYVPGAASLTAAILDRFAGADAVFFDGTLFADDEMIATGTGTKTGRRMGHMPLDGMDGTLVALGGIKARRILTHINNTNPILIADSPERRKVESLGFEIAEDGMEIVL